MFAISRAVLEWTHHGNTATFTFDDTNQLTAADHANQPDESYSYDDNGNRVNGANVIGSNNQLLSDGTASYTYDDEGNLIRKTTTATGEYIEFTYDHRNRMVSAATFSVTGTLIQQVDYDYDVFDRRVARTVDSDGAGPVAPQTVYSIYNGENVWADLSQSGDVLVQYLFGDTIDDLLARWTPTDGTAWYLKDHLGTVQDLVNAAGVIINTVTYDSFGNIANQSNASVGDRFTYTGREWDDSLELYYFRARLYNSSTGRFLSEDPLGFAGGDANLFRYVKNSPLSYRDPSGRTALTEDAAFTPT